MPNQASLTEEQNAIVEEFLQELQDELMILFKQRYMEAKAFGEKNPSSYLVFEAGRYVNYMEIFPRNSELLDFSHNDGKYFAEDSYELDPRKDQKSVRLTFYKFDPNEEKLPPLFTYNYHFEEDKREAEDSRLDSEQNDVLVDIHRFIPNLHDILSKRYKETKKIGKELLDNAPRLEFQPHKIARNEVCPCGSGKKFKKCCALKLN